MVSAVKFAKKIAPAVPYKLGALVAKIPYSWRPKIGRVYSQRTREIQELRCSTAEQKHFVLDRIQKLLKHAIHHIPFYRDHYKTHGFKFSHLRTFDDIKSIPTVCKSDFLACELADRSDSNQRGKLIVNTGGSSGRTLSFYVQDDSFGHERAHIHHIWAALGFQSHEAVLTFNGRAELSRPVTYDALRHAFNVDIYENIDCIAKELRLILNRRKTPFSFIHGYPSAIYSFLTQLHEYYPEIVVKLRSVVRGVFLGSEFPNPVWRESMERILDAPSVSWYGHTERCVLADDSLEHYHYRPLLSYGHTEVDCRDGESFLIGTNYYNFASPFIRYNTEDSVDVLDEEDGLLKCFSVLNGRRGEFILDRRKRQVSLTGLIHGRHHKLFDVCRSIQVSQTVPGHATIHYCPNQTIKSVDPPAMFDASKVEIKFEFSKCPEPIRTASGKSNLLISNHLSEISEQ